MRSKREEEADQATRLIMQMFSGLLLFLVLAVGFVVYFGIRQAGPTGATGAPGYSGAMGAPGVDGPTGAPGRSAWPGRRPRSASSTRRTRTVRCRRGSPASC